ncbi:MAG TPA: disulfide bond formation protein B [Sphingomicrobium sp.]|nr:disulfide bond formation protein B [Sphingomicrobium sp.]
MQWRFLGISMAGWNAILSLGGAALILLLALKAKRA